MSKKEPAKEPAKEPDKPKSRKGDRRFGVRYGPEVIEAGRQCYFSGMSAPEACIHLRERFGTDVAERSFVKWITRYGWKKDRDKHWKDIREQQMHKLTTKRTVVVNTAQDKHEALLHDAGRLIEGLYRSHKTPTIAEVTVVKEMVSVTKLWIDTHRAVLRMDKDPIKQDKVINQIAVKVVGPKGDMDVPQPTPDAMKQFIANLPNQDPYRFGDNGEEEDNTEDRTLLTDLF